MGDGQGAVMKPNALAVMVAFLAATITVGAQEWQRNWDAAQRLKPAQVDSVARITAANEAGTPLVVHVAVLDVVGKPAAGIDVFAYQTDSTGLYAQPGAADAWRLKGWAVTDAHGQFELRTIRPSPYPHESVPAHIHVVLTTRCCGRQSSELMFEDDPLVTKEFRSRPRALDIKLYGNVDRRADGSQDVSYTLRLRSKGDS